MIDFNKKNTMCILIVIVLCIVVLCLVGCNGNDVKQTTTGIEAKQTPEPPVGPPPLTIDDPVELETIGQIYPGTSSTMNTNTTPEEVSTTSPWLYVGIGAGVVILAVGSVFVVKAIKRKKEQW